MKISFLTNLRAFAALTVMALGASSAVHASAVVNGFINGGTLAKCDDCTTSAALGFSLNYFGTTYSSAWITNNGAITFGGPEESVASGGLTAAYHGNPILAAFLADVDTRGVGSVTFGTGSYGGNSAFAVTWNGVGYYDGGTNKRDTFQILLVNNDQTPTVGDFDFMFNYGSIQWESGAYNGGHNGLGGSSASVGWSKGTGAAGTYSQFAGSKVNGALIDGGVNSLAAGTNDGVTGQYRFTVDGSSIKPYQAPTVSAVPEPESYALLLVGMAGIVVAKRRTKSRSSGHTMQL